jgi:hypothetical protein
MFGVQDSNISLDPWKINSTAERLHGYEVAQYEQVSALKSYAHHSTKAGGLKNPADLQHFCLVEMQVEDDTRASQQL